MQTFLHPSDSRSAVILAFLQVAEAFKNNILLFRCSDVESWTRGLGLNTKFFWFGLESWHMWSWSWASSSIMSFFSTLMNCLNTGDVEMSEESSMMTSHLPWLSWRHDPTASSLTSVTSFSTVSRSPDRVTSSMKPILTSDSRLVRRECAASQNSKGPNWISKLGPFLGQNLTFMERQNWFTWTNL